MEQKPPFLTGVVHTLVLFSFAVAQPLFDLLSRYPEFFVARQSKPIDLILLALALCVGLPLLVISLEGAARLVGPRLHKWLHTALVAVLVSVINLQVLKRIAEISGITLVIAAALCAVLISVVYLRFRLARTYLTVLSPVLLLFPGLFFLDTEIYRFVFREQAEVGYAKVGATAPIVMVVFDEFALTSLLDEQRQIDPIRYPNFARLAKQSYWFRKATTVSDSTLLSLPAMLTGQSPQLADPRLPTVADHPHSLFTLLAGSYHLQVFENVTQLSPSTAARESVSERMKSLLADLAIVYAHLLLPPDLTVNLPTITQSWKNFTSVMSHEGEVEGNFDGVKTLQDFEKNIDVANRSGKFQEFIDSIQPNDRPTLWFMHSMLPHGPWEYLPSGKHYSLRETTNRGIVNVNRGDGAFPAWVDDQWLVIQGYQRYLLQTLFVDKLLGDLISKLEEVDLYDRSLIVITADHGVSFRKGSFLRRASETNYPDIMSIPLFIKTPYQREGVLSDRNVETIDILPTIADVLDISLLRSTDGRSALDQSLPERSEKTIFAGIKRKFVFDGNLDSKGESLRRKLEFFGSGPRSRLFAIGPHADLVGRQVSEIGVVKEADTLVEIEGETFFEDVHLDSRFILTNIRGRILSGRHPYSPRHLAIAVNDRVQAVTQMSSHLDDGKQFVALVPETAFRSGRNNIEIFSVVQVDGKPSLERFPRESRPHYVLLTSIAEQTERLLASDGKSIPIAAGDLSGWVESVVNEETSTVYIRGWAVDVNQPRLAASILVFKNQELLYSGITDMKRPDVAEAEGFPEWASLTPGFYYQFPVTSFDDLGKTKIRVFALSRGNTASELNYNGQRWVFASTTPTAQGVSP